MINPLEAIYTGADLEDATLGVLQFRSPGGTIKAAYLYVGDNVSDDAVFNISIENVALWTLGDRLTVLDGESETSKTGLNIVTVRGDVIQLDLEEVPETGITAPVTLILEIEDGVELPEGGGLTTEQVQDVVGAMMVSGTNTLWIYDDALGTLKVDSSSLSDEDIQDKVAAMLSAGTNVTVTYNDPAGTLSISSATRTDEEIQDVVAALLAQGSNVTLTYNDAGNSLTIAASGGAGSDDTKADKTANINAQTGTTYTLVAADNNKIVTLENAAAITLTVPAGLGAGFNCLIVQLGAGQVTIAASGTTIHNRQSHTKLAGQYASATIAAYSSNNFIMQGDTTV
jgi:hypothetical protein